MIKNKMVKFLKNYLINLLQKIQVENMVWIICLEFWSHLMVEN